MLLLGALIALAAASTELSAQQITWEPYGDPVFGGAVLSLAVDRNGDVYAGTYDHGVYRSSDAGAHWTIASAGLTSLRILDLHSFATAGYLLARTYEGVFRSTDAGVTWDSVMPPGVLAINDGSSTAYVITRQGTYYSTDRGERWVQTADTTPIYTARAAVVDRATGTLFTADERAIIRSNDNGGTWTAVAAGLGRYTASTITSFQQGSNGALFATGYRVGIYRSDDSGSTWVVADEGLDPASTWWTIAPAPDGRLMAVGDTGQVYLSTNNGDLWYRSGYSMQMRPNALLFLDDTDALAGFDDYGVEKSGDSARTFASSSDGMTALTGGLNVGVDAYDRVYAGTGKMVYRKDDSAAPWQSLHVPKTTYVASPFAFAPNGWIASGLALSHDDGATWNIEHDGINSFGLYVSDLVVDPTGRILAATANGVFFIDEDATTWSGPRLGGLGLLAIAMDQDGTLFAGGIRYIMYRSTDGGLSWEEASSGLPVSISDRTSDIGADAEGNIYAATSQGVYRSSNKGAVWSRLSVGPDSARPFIRLLVNPAGLILALAENPARLYSSSDHGATWLEQTGTLPGNIASLALDGNGRIYAGVIGDGQVYRSISTTSSVDAMPFVSNGPVIRSITPNPVRNPAQIEFDLKARSHVALRVVDILGNEVWHTVSGELEVGTQRLRLELGGVPSGFYVVQLEVNGEVFSDRIVVD